MDKIEIRKKYIKNAEKIKGQAISQSEMTEIDLFLEDCEKFFYPTQKKNGKDIDIQQEKQHKVPQVFLNRFSNGDNMLYQYDIKGNKISDNLIPTSALLIEKDFYVFEDNDSRMNYFFEKYLFSFYLEGKIKDVIDKIDNKEFLNRDNWHVLSGFISYQYVRTDAFINRMKANYEYLGKNLLPSCYSSFKEFEAFIKQMETETGEVVEDVNRLYEFMMSDKWKCEVNKKSIIVNALSLGNKFRPYFLNGSYEVLESKGDSFFIVSDNPFFIIPPVGRKKGNGIGLWGDIGERIIPISRKKCLRIKFSSVSFGPSLSYRL